MSDNPSRAVFLDRDGPVIIDKHYMHDPEIVELAPGAAEGLKLLRKHNFKIILISDQSGVGRGYFPEKSAWAVHERMLELLREQDAVLDGWHYCFHSPDDNCLCRKPKPTFIQKAAEKHNVDLSRSFMGGDKRKDILTGKNAHPFIKSILIGEHESEKLVATEENFADYKAADLLDAARWIISETWSCP